MGTPSDIATSRAGDIAKNSFNQIWQQFEYLFRYKSNIENLKNELDELETKRLVVEQQIDEAKRNAEVIFPDVLSWMRKVKEEKKEAINILNSTANANMRWLCAKCPNMKSRYSLSKKAAGKTTELLKLKENSKFDKVGNPAPPGQMPYASPGDDEKFESRKSTHTVVFQFSESEEMWLGKVLEDNIGK